MKNKITVVIIFLLGFLMLNAQTNEYNYTAYFDSGKHELNEIQYKDFKIWIDMFRNKELSRIHITGHTDSQGSAETNLILSEKRAATISNYFHHLGTSESIISIDYQGEGNLRMTDTDNDDSKAQNRRVEIRIQLQVHRISYENDYSPTNKSDEEIEIKEAPIKLPISNELFYEKVDNPAQLFTISTNEISEITGEKGTIIMLGENILCDCETEELVSGKVDISLKEYQNTSDFLLGNLSTKSDRQMLSSSGTIHIAAKQNGKELCIKKGKSYEVLFPINPNTQSLNMTSFEGRRDSNGDMNWKKQEGSDNLLNYDVLAAAWSLRNCGGFSSLGEKKYSRWKRFCLFFKRFPRSLYSRVQLSKKKQEEFLARRKENQRKRTAMMEGNISTEELDMATVNYYVLKMNDLGWRNCDMFMDIPKQQLAYMNVNLKPQKNMSLKLVFPNRNAIMQGNPVQGKNRYSFGGIPRGEKAKLVAIRLGNELPEIATMDVRVGTSINMTDFVFQSYSITEMREILSSIN